MPLPADAFLDAMIAGGWESRLLMKADGSSNFIERPLRQPYNAASAARLAKLRQIWLSPDCKAVVTLARRRRAMVLDIGLGGLCGRNGPQTDRQNLCRLRSGMFAFRSGRNRGLPIQ